MSELADERFAPPQAHVEDLATGEVVLAGRGARLVAVIVDTIIATALIWVVNMVPMLRQMFWSQSSSSSEGMWSLTLGSTVLGVLVFLFVQGWPLVTRGQTVGKMLLKLRIVRPDGSKPDALRLLGLRYGIGYLSCLIPAAAMIYGLIDSLLIFRGSRKCLHDTIADTQVIKL